MDEQQLQQQIVQLVQAAMQGDQQATEQIQQIMQAAQSGDQQAVQLAQMIQSVAQQMQQVQAAKFGAKLNYIDTLRGICPQGYETKYFKKGGRLCKTCQPVNVAPMDYDPISSFKQGRKIKKGQTGSVLPDAGKFDKTFTSYASPMDQFNNLRYSNSPYFAGGYAKQAMPMRQAMDPSWSDFYDTTNPYQAPTSTTTKTPDRTKTRQVLEEKCGGKTKKKK